MTENKQLLQEKVLGQFTQYDINTLKQTLAASLNPAEFGLFLNTCVATGLNPFLKQVIPVVYDGKNGRRFNIQVPVEGIEHLARQKEGWQGYNMQLVCENDDFKARWDNEAKQWDIVKHEIAFPRGKTMGAYCIVPRSGFKDVVIFMGVEEVQHLLQDSKTQKMWSNWFNDMFKKHVKKRGLREQYGIEIDDMSDLNSGPETFENNIPAYKPQERKEIQEEPTTEAELEEMQQELWEDIASIMGRHLISQAEALDICKRRFNGKEPQQLNGQELAAYKKFLELEGNVKKAHAQKERQASKMAQIEPKEEQPKQQDPEPQKEPQKANNKVDEELSEFDLFFDDENQGELF